MKAVKAMILIGLALGLLVWVIDTVVDYFVYFRGELFWRLLPAIRHENQHELFVRCLGLAGLPAFGLLAAGVTARCCSAADIVRAIPSGLSIDQYGSPNQLDPNVEGPGPETQLARPRGRL